MSEFPRPIVVVSRCLGFAPCRYNGQTIPDAFVGKLEEYVDLKTVCPEVEMGLGVPRDPLRIVQDGEKRILYQPATGKDVTAGMLRFMEDFFRSAGVVDGFILKNRSPSCGPADVKVYRGLRKDAAVTRGGGFFGMEAVNRYPGKPVEDEGRLRNFTIREHFLTRLYACARFRELKERLLQKPPSEQRRSMAALIDFHSRFKYLLMAYNQARLKILGALVANHERRGMGELLELYERHFERVFERAPNYRSMINVLYHAYGGLASALKTEEKRFFLNAVEEYRDERIPLSALIHVLEAWSVGQENRYLLNQVLLRPYPRELVEVSDSGKGRQY
jgi:uncharacterized protein YbgA (DUF1722 family)/uncharacterized protein YbbK (DUF523 family)